MDRLLLELQMPLYDSEKVIGLDLLLFFDYRLYVCVKKLKSLCFWL